MREVVTRQFVCDLCGYVKSVSKTASLPNRCPACSGVGFKGRSINDVDNQKNDYVHKSFYEKDFYSMLLSCYRSGQINEATWQLHLQDKDFMGWLHQQ